MADDLLPPPNDPPPPPEPRATKKIVCEFCECQLTPAGEVLRRGEAAKRFSRMEEALETANNETARVQRELDEAKARISELSQPAARRGLNIPI